MEQKRKLDVQCSPGTFRKVETDLNYRASVLQQLSGDEIFQEITFSQNVQSNTVGLTEEIDIDLPSGSTDIKKIGWLDAPTKFLISRIKELKPKVGKCASLKNKKQMWSKIAEDLSAKGYLFNAVQVEAKYFSLERQYKKTQLNNSKTGRSRQTCPYQSELDEIFRDKKSMNPEYILDSESDVTPEDIPCKDGKDSNSSTDFLDLTPSTSKRKKTSLEIFMEKADQHAAKRDINDAQLQKMLEESINKREARAERKQALEKRKVELLESLVDILKKN